MPCIVGSGEKLILRANIEFATSILVVMLLVPFAAKNSTWPVLFEKSVRTSKNHHYIPTHTSDDIILILIQIPKVQVHLFKDSGAK